MSSKPFTRGPLFALVAALSFGAVALCAKVVYENGGSAVFFILLRASAGVIVIGAALLMVHGRLAFIRAKPLAMMIYAAGILGIAFGYMGAIAFIPASLAVLFFYVFPVLTVVAVALRDRRRPDALGIGSALGAFGGLVLILGGQTDGLAWQGVALGLLAATGGMATLLMSPILLREGDALEVSFTASVVILPPAFLIGLSAGDIAVPDGSTVMIVLAMAAVLYGLGLVTQIQAVYDTDIDKIGILFNVEPVFVIIVATALLGESLSERQWIGAAIVITAALAVAWPRRGVTLSPE